MKTDPGQSDTRARVLLVDDQRIIAEALRRALAGEPDMLLKWEPDGARAQETALAWRPTVILQDLMLPNVDGFELLRRYRADPELANIPVVVLSSRDVPSIKAQGFEAGANDFLIKLPDRIELLARLRYHSAACRSMQERDAAFRALRASMQALAEANKRLQVLAEVDGLTGIANRRRFDEALQAEWQRAQRTRRPLSLLLADVDFFKQFNDAYGHAAGDACLRRVADALNGCLRRPADLCARYGGEEFALVLPETDAAGARQVGEAGRVAVQALDIAHTGSPYRKVSLSVGVACAVPAPDSEPTQLADAADRALYGAKKAGRNRVEG